MPDNWITLVGGQAYPVDRPNQALIRPADVAHALAQINRFNGHASRPYSVAEHCLLVADIAERDLGLDVFGVLGAICHDGHEYVTGDQHTPGKRAIGEAWRQYEGRHEHAFWSAFALHTIMATHRQAIKLADLIALATERRDLLPQRGPAAGMRWECLDGIEACSRVDLNSPERIAARWTYWRDAWLLRFTDLDFARNQALFHEADCAASRSSGSSPQPEGGGGNTTGGEGRPAPTLHFVSGGSRDFLGPTGDRRFWPVEVKASGLPAESNEADATDSMPREGQADSSGLSAEGDEAAAASTTAAEAQADAEAPEPVDWHFNRMLQQLGGKPA